MHLKNKFVVEDFLKQRYPMLMVGEVIEFDGNCIKAYSAFGENSKATNGKLSSWMILEAAGQVAELMWRLSGLKEECYLAKMDKIVGLQKDNFHYEREYMIIAQKAMVFGNLYKSSITFFYDENTYMNGEIVHCFSKKQSEVEQ